MAWAINEMNTRRERTRREAIDEMLLTLCNLARVNDQAARRLQGILIGAPPGEQRPERAARPGWLGEIVDALESTIEYLEDTAKVINEVFPQVAPQMPTAAAPPSRGMAPSKAERGW